MIRTANGVFGGDNAESGLEDSSDTRLASQPRMVEAYSTDQLPPQPVQGGGDGVPVTFGATGSFTTGGAYTITVVNGIITSIV